MAQVKPPIIYNENEEDNLEYLSDLEKLLDTGIEPEEENKYSNKVPPRIQKLRDLLRSSNIPYSQGLRFLAGVELDIKRKKDNLLLIEDLFLQWCKNGNKTWLSPLEILSKYEEVLLLYNGKGDSIAPFVQNLIALSKEKISPHAFLRYVQNPRMGTDYNWREWKAKHYNSLKIISDILLELRTKPPFDKDILGTEFVKIARDIVLIKYVGKPLARFSEDVLKNKSAISTYKENWSNLKLNNTAFLIFLKRNVLPILYAISGKVELQHLNRIVVHLPEVENLFAENFPEEYITSLVNGTPNIYGDNFEKGFDDRRKKGYSYYDFVVETESFLEILKALLKTRSGYFLFGWYSRLLIGKKDPELAFKIAKLVSVLNDAGGKHIYIWHTRKLVALPTNERDIYLELVRSNNGCDPAYPNIRAIFALPEETGENNYLLNLAQQLGIPLNEFMTKNGVKISIKGVLNAYLKINPSATKPISEFRKEVCNGEDKLWNEPKLKYYDSLGEPVYPLLLRSVIKGIGINYFRELKSTNLSSLYQKYPITQSVPWNIQLDFKIPHREIGNINKFIEEEAKKKINFGLLHDVILPFLEENPVSIDNFISFLNKEDSTLKTSEIAKEEEKRGLELKLGSLEQGTEANKDELKKSKDALKKSENSLKFIKEKRMHYKEIMEAFPLLSEDEKFLVALYLAGYIAEPGNEFYSFTIALFLNRYKTSQRLKAQLDFLREDITLETLNYTQVCYFLNCLELCKSLLQNDANLIKIQSKPESKLHELLKTYIVTKNKKLTTEALDAAFHKLCAGGKINSEKSKWQDILENTEKNLEKKKTPFQLFVSRSSLDAYYGDMGGICLSNYPAEIKRENFYIIRLVDVEEEIIVGMSIVVLSKAGIPSLGIKNYWAAFAFNPLNSLVSGYSLKNQLLLYMQYRLVLEKISEQSKLPVAIMGIHSYGILSNTSCFADVILKYEGRKNTPSQKVRDALGVQLYYDESQYKQAMLVIDPSNKNTYSAEETIKLLIK